MSTTDATFRKEICYDRATRDYALYLDGELIGFAPTYHDGEVKLNALVHDLLSEGVSATVTTPDSGNSVEEIAADAGEVVAAAVVIPRPGIHLNMYTVVLSQPGETFCYDRRTLCDTCRATTPNASKEGEVMGGYCDQCGVGPSVSHFQLSKEQITEQMDPFPLLGTCAICGCAAWTTTKDGLLCPDHLGVLREWEHDYQQHGVVLC